jgi:hypothetical protein
VATHGGALAFGAAVAKLIVSDDESRRPSIMPDKVHPRVALLGGSLVRVSSAAVPVMTPGQST